MGNAVCHLLLALFFAAGWSQTKQNDLSPRDLFYREDPDDDKLISPGGAKHPSNDITPLANTPPSAVVRHLGLRYGVFVIDKQGRSVPTDPDRAFQAGEIVAFEFEPNRSGYLYVLEQGSSGKWKSLFPSNPKDDNFVRALTKVEIPGRTEGFQIEGVPGVERVFVVLSRNPEDLLQLTEAIRSDAETAAQRQAEPALRLVTAPSRLDQVVENLTKDLGSRELGRIKISQPQAGKESPNSVYVVNVSETPKDRIVAEIRINHPR